MRNTRKAKNNQKLSTMNTGIYVSTFQYFHKSLIYFGLGRG